MRLGRLGSRVLAFACVLAAVAAAASPSSAYQRPGQTGRVSVSSGGVQSREPTSDTTRGCNGMGLMDMTPNGRYVAFASAADNLVPGDTNGACDIFVRDRWREKTVRVSVSSTGHQTTGSGATAWDPTQLSPDSVGPAISANGRYVSFSSFAGNLVPGDTDLDEDVFVHDMKTHATIRVSLDSNGNQALLAPCQNLSTVPPTAASWDASMSSNGRYVAFESCAPNLAGGDTNLAPDVFVHDLRTKETLRVSLDAHGHQIQGTSFYPSISGDGRFVDFTTTVAVPGAEADQTINHWDVFVRDLRKRTTALASPGLDGPGTWDSGTGVIRPGGRQISAAGRYVVFSSEASNLIPNDSNGTFPSAVDIFVRDLRAGRTQRVSVSSFGEQADAGSFDGTTGASISPDGRYIVFTAESSQFYRDGQASSSPDVFLYDRSTGQLDWLSSTPGGRKSSKQCGEVVNKPYRRMDGYPFPGSFGGPVSADGRYVGFESCSADLVAHDTNRAQDYFVRDRGPARDVGGLTSSGRLSMDGSASFDSTGLATGVDPASDLNRALTGQGANLIGASMAYRPLYADLFVREELRSMPSVSGTPAFGNPGILYGLDFRANGSRYEVRAQRIPGSDFDQGGGASFALFRYEPALGIWTQVAALRGGYGTTGEEVVFSIPLRSIGLGQGGRLRHLRAFTAFGSFATGSAATLDSVKL